MSLQGENPSHISTATAAEVWQLLWSKNHSGSGQVREVNPSHRPYIHSSCCGRSLSQPVVHPCPLPWSWRMGLLGKKILIIFPEKIRNDSQRNLITCKSFWTQELLLPSILDDRNMVHVQFSKCSILTNPVWIYYISLCTIKARQNTDFLSKPRGFVLSPCKIVDIKLNMVYGLILFLSILYLYLRSG